MEGNPCERASGKQWENMISRHQDLGVQRFQVFFLHDVHAVHVVCSSYSWWKHPTTGNILHLSLTISLCCSVTSYILALKCSTLARWKHSFKSASKYQFMFMLLRRINFAFATVCLVRSVHLLPYTQHSVPQHLLHHCWHSNCFPWLWCCATNAPRLCLLTLPTGRMATSETVCKIMLQQTWGRHP